MTSTTTLMTAQIPSYVGMPASGHALGSDARIAGSAAAFVAPTCVVRDRKAVTGTGLVQGYFPGTSAWRPPTC